MKIETTYSKKYHATMVLISSSRYEYSKLLEINLTNDEFFKELKEIIEDAEFTFKELELELPLNLSSVMCTNNTPLDDIKKNKVNELNQKRLNDLKKHDESL